MEEVALMKCQFLPVSVLRLVIVESFDDFLGRDYGNGAFRQGEVRLLLLLFLVLERPADSLAADPLALHSNGMFEDVVHKADRRWKFAFPYLHLAYIDLTVESGGESVFSKESLGGSNDFRRGR